MNRKDSALVSVLIPVFNCEKYIKEALESVFSQTYRNLEVIVADDGSTDHTSEIISYFPAVKYYYQEHRGVAAARNLALEKANGKWIAFLDADDRWNHQKIQLQMDYLREHPGCRILFCEAENFCDIPIEHRSRRQQELLESNLRHILPSALIDADLFKKVGMFDTECSYGEDTEWFTAAAMMGVNISWKLPDVLYQRRIHDSNISADHKSFGKKEILAIKAKIIRKYINEK